MDSRKCYHTASIPGLWSALQQPGSQSLAGTPGPGSSWCHLPRRLALNSQCLGKKHHSDWNLPCTLWLVAWCRGGEILRPGNAFSIIMVTSNEATLPSGEKRPLGAGLQREAKQTLCHSEVPFLCLCICWKSLP